MEMRAPTQQAYCILSEMIAAPVVMLSELKWGKRDVLYELWLQESTR